jgi:hypothetical protein
MIGFETDLSDLRASSQELGKAADAAGVAHDGVRKQDVPVAAGAGSVFDIGMFSPDTAFGKSLGMRAVSEAYEEHRREVEKMLAKLHESALGTSVALVRIAELYEQADEDSNQRVNRAANQDQG